MVTWMTIRLSDVSTVTMDDNQADRGRNGTLANNHFKKVGTSTMDNGHAVRGQYLYHG